MALMKPTLILLLCLGLAPAFGTAAAADDMTLRLGAGDRINVQVFGQPNISGEFVVDTQGNIVLPIGGTVPAADATPAELQQRIVNVLADGYILRPRVSVRTLELRPVYVVGDVRVGGALPFRAGMTALTAIAMAGGPALNDPQAAAFRGDLVDAEERVSLLEMQEVGVRARIARLEAQQSGVAEPVFPEDLRQGGPEIQRILAGERAIFNAERESDARQVDQIMRQLQSAEAEMRSLAELLRLERGQLEVAQSYQTEMARLARSGLVDRRRLVDSQREVARIESSLARLVTENARTAQIGHDAQLRLDQLRGAAEQRAAVGLQEARARLAEIGSGIVAGREQVALRSQRITAAGAAVGRSSGPALIMLTRVQQGVPMTMQADENTPLLPGDILLVSGGSVRVAGSASEPATQPDFRRN